MMTKKKIAGCILLPIALLMALQTLYVYFRKPIFFNTYDWPFGWMPGPVAGADGITVLYDFRGNMVAIVRCNRSKGGLLWEGGNSKGTRVFCDGVNVGVPLRPNTLVEVDSTGVRNIRRLAPNESNRISEEIGWGGNQVDPDRLVAIVSRELSGTSTKASGG